MAMQRIAIVTLREIMRCKFELHLSNRQIGKSLAVSSTTVGKYLKVTKIAGISWPSVASTSDAELELLCHVAPVPKRPAATLNLAEIHQELKHKGVTLYLIWEEYRTHHGEQAYSYSQFCRQYRHYRRRLTLTLRQNHRAGEKLFIDYCGPTMPIINRYTGEIGKAHIFVAVLGASSYTFAEATHTQSLPNWIASHVRAFTFFQGVPALLVPDNLRACSSRACRYEPTITLTYRECAEHYGTVILPTRPYKPRDKAKVEAGVLLVERWIMARLRHQQFFSLAELNQAIAILLHDLNIHPFKKLPGSRLSQFELFDKPALKPLPATPYEYADFKSVSVNMDYHVEIDKHYYSVPYQFVKTRIDARFTETTIELLCKGKRIASHTRSYFAGKHTTDPEHMPKSHRAHLEWSPERFLNWGESIGQSTRDVVKHLLNKPHPEQGYRACLGLLNTAKRYGKERLEVACQHALTLGSPTRRSVLSILEKGLDKKPLPCVNTSSSSPNIQHENVRGADYFKTLSNSLENSDAEPTNN